MAFLRPPSSESSIKGSAGEDIVIFWTPRNNSFDVNVSRRERSEGRESLRYRDMTEEPVTYRPEVGHVWAAARWQIWGAPLFLRADSFHRATRIARSIKVIFLPGKFFSTLL
jgi:hypothetical protein